MKTLTVKEVKEACQSNRFVIVNYISGAVGGVNCAVLPKALKKREYKESKHTKVVSIQPCTFMEYISYKSSFVR